MRRVLALALLLLSAPCLTGCDTASVYEECVGGGGGCPPSTFLTESERGREIGGFVVQGDRAVPAALVRMEPVTALTSSASFLPMTTITSEAGEFRFSTAPFVYDLWVRADREVIVHRGLAYRRYDPPLDAAIDPPSWSSTLGVTLDPPIAPGSDVRFFASGADVLGVDGALEDGLTVRTRTFGAVATLHAVEFPKGGELYRATRIAHGDVRVLAGKTAVLTMKLEPITDVVDVVLEVDAPDGFTVEPAEISLDFGVASSRAVLARLPVGLPARLPLFPFGLQFAEVHASRDGASSDSGRQPFDPRLGRVRITLPDAPSPASPAAGSELTLGSAIAAEGKGVLEHVFTPASGSGTVLRIVTANLTGTIPDAALMGVPALDGAYLWTVRSFPDFQFVDSFSGGLARRYRASAISPPRPVTFRVP